MKKNLILDCDPGIDDAIAILFAAKYANVHGITTVSGNVSLADTTRNALALLEVADIDVPVHSGAAHPLQSEPIHAEYVHGKHGFGDASLPTPSRAVASTDAVGYLLESSRTIGDLWVVAVGPLTNIAMAIKQDPHWVQRIQGISIMGGSTGLGNITPVAEFNVWADPEAAYTVFNSGAHIKLCGLNLTHQLQTEDSVIQQLNQNGNSSTVAQLAFDLLSALHTRLSAITGTRSAALHDPCAVVALTHAELIKFERFPVNVELDGALTRGMTVFDMRRYSSQAFSNSIEVGMSIDSAYTMQLILDTLLEY